MPVDYSKWKDIEISDDEDDTHPNVDTPSLFRWRHQARLERMAEKKQKKDDVESHLTSYQAKIVDLQKKLADASLDDETKAKLKAEYDETEKQMAEWRKKEEELAEQEKHEKWNVDTISHDKWSTTRINKAGSKKPTPSKKSEEEEMKEMTEFFNKYKDEIKKFSKLKSFVESEKYLLEHPHLCCEWTANHITLDALNAGIMEEEEQLHNIARQCISLQYLLELAKQLKANPQAPSLIQGFFRKINAAEESYMRMFNDEVAQFIDRVHARAAVKREEAMKEYEEEEKKKRIAQSPGGLDPIEVLESLPQAMREAFESQDIPRLQQVASEMPTEEFKYHLDRCIKSGLWLPDANAKKANEETGGEQSMVE